MNHADRSTAVYAASAVLLALLVAWAVHGRPPAVSSVQGAADTPTASLGQWIVVTFPTAEAGFARRAPAIGD